jgi:hypothetical protein
VEEAEQRRRLAAQQAEEREKKLAEERRQAAEQAQREQRLAEIRRQRERAQREAQAAEARLRQLAEATGADGIEQCRRHCTQHAARWRRWQQRGSDSQVCCRRAAGRAQPMDTSGQHPGRPALPLDHPSVARR